MRTRFANRCDAEFLDGGDDVGSLEYNDSVELRKRNRPGLLQVAQRAFRHAKKLRRLIGSQVKLVGCFAGPSVGRRRFFRSPACA